MPHYKDLPSLLDTVIGFCIDYLEHLFSKSSAEDLATLRSIILPQIHAKLRQTMLNEVLNRYKNNITAAFPFVQILVDSSTTHLNLHSGSLEASSGSVGLEDYTKLARMLNEYAPKKLTELSVSMKFNQRSELGYLRLMNMFIHSSLDELTLIQIADNKILTILGHNCPHLSYLNVLSSWLVSFEGIAGLCFKDPGLTPEQDFDTLPLDKVPNKCCQTLTYVGIKDTNVYSVGLFLLFFYVPNLTSVGGYIYYSSVGKVVADYFKRFNRTLNLTHIWETGMNATKAAAFIKALPRLEQITASGKSGADMVVLNNVRHVTFDCDFSLNNTIEVFLEAKGSNLRSLTLIDQNVPLDIGVITECCPGLEALTARLCGSAASGNLPYLIRVNIKLASVITLCSFLNSASNVKQIVIEMREDQYGEGCDLLTDAVISNLLDTAILPAIEYFEVLTPCELTPVSLYNLIEACPHLRRVESIHNWDNVSEADISRIESETRSNNWDLVITFRFRDYPRSRRKF